MKTAASKKEAGRRATLEKTLKTHSREIMEEINGEIALNAHKLSNLFLADIIRALFGVERTCEHTSPIIYEMSQDSDLILLDKLNSLQLEKLPFYILNEEVLAKNLQPIIEIEFIALIDLSLSMLYRWPLMNLAFAERFVSTGEMEELKRKCRKTKLYALKYLAYAFLQAALQNGFQTKAIFFGNQMEHEVRAGKDRNFPAFALHYIDEHYQKVYGQAVTSSRYSEIGGYLNAIMKATYNRKKFIVFIISDFLDGIENIKPYLIELNHKRPIIAAVVNDPFEVKFPPRKFLTPVTLTHEHCKNMEQNLGEEIRLSRDLINDYNSTAARRRQDLFDFFNSQRIRHLDIQTQDNHKIPKKIEELDLMILGNS